MTTQAKVGLDITPVAGALGAEIRGLQLRDIDDDTFAAIDAALLEHLVVFFPEQDLTPDEHVAFATRFGEAEIHPLLPKLDDEHPEIIVLEGSVRVDMWHTDVTFSPHPPICSVLKMVSTAARGGDTMWTNQCRAYEALSDPMRNLLDGLTAVHWARPYGRPEIQAIHPVVRVHPRTDRRALYVNRSWTSHIRELSTSESDALLQYLFGFSEQPEFTCRYRWAPGTIAVWDNRVTQHRVVNDYRDDARRIERVTILGDDPVGNPPLWDPHEGDKLSAYSLEARSRAPVPLDERAEA